MKRIFVLFSIIVLLGSNIAVAMDSDCLPTTQQQSTLDHDQNTDTDNDSVDNSCHSTLHLVGIYPDVLNKSSIITKQYTIAPPFDLTSSQTYQPATPPPNV